ncbi:hypothetical protein TrCOL_g11505 [Triparma columacea]|uniref:UBX domain-containing protein n=1 Tax=Triparma columacea TaxID=722753 RepID=A0A9W7G708_9STRA|nr:hypothetical protein TrCOL_g11505 [Triparma columacea]
MEVVDLCDDTSNEGWGVGGDLDVGGDLEDVDADFEVSDGRGRKGGGKERERMMGDVVDGGILKDDIRAVQDAEYRATLEEDKRRERKAKEAVEEDIFKGKIEEAIKVSEIEAEEEGKKRRERVENRIREDMPKEGEEGDTVVIAIRKPSGEKVVERFYEDTMGSVCYELVGTWEECVGRDFEINTVDRKRVEKGERIGGIGLGKRGVLVVRYTD